MGQPQAIRALVDDEPMKSIPTRAGFVAETKPRPAPGETRRHLDQNLGTVLKNPELPNPSTASTFGHRRADGRLVHVQSDICDIFHQARPYAGGSVPAIRHNPRHCACRGRAADHSANIGSSFCSRSAAAMLVVEGC